jgi:hypothetical protein
MLLLAWRRSPSDNQSSIPSSSGLHRKDAKSSRELFRSVSSLLWFKPASSYNSVQIKFWNLIMRMHWRS